MPYDKTNMPEHVKKMPAELQDAWLGAFNGAMKEYNDEGKAMATANSMIAKMGYKKDKDGNYVKAAREIDIISSPIMFTIPEGKKFVKEVIYEGEFVHPNNKNKKLSMTIERFQEWVNNFKKKLIDIVYVPLNHSDNPADNTGVIEDMWIGKSESMPGKMALFAKFNIVLDEIAEKIGKTILGNSIGVERFFSPETGEDMGEVMGHIALTNEPFIPYLGEFKSVAFSKGDVNLTHYILERDAKDKQEDFMTEKEVLELKEKMLELERKAKDAEDKAELARKEKELESKKVTELEKTNFEREITSEIDKLVLSKKVIPAEKDSEIKFAISLGKEKAQEYIQKLSKRADVIEMGSKAAGNPDEKASGVEKPKASELMKTFVDCVILKKISQKQAFEKLTDWEKRFNLTKAHIDDADKSVKFTRSKIW